MAFDQSGLKRLATLTDDIGVLSLYATLDPRDEAAKRPAWQIRIGNELNDLRARVTEEADRARREKILARIEDLQPEIDLLLDAGQSGLGRALFAPVSTGEVHTVSLQLPVGDRVVLEPNAYIRPLVTASGVGAPAGLVVVSKDGIRLIDHRLGEVRELEPLSFDLVTADWRRKVGPAGANPALPQHSASQQDKFDRRVEEHLGRFLRSVAPKVSGRADEMGWQALLIAGEPRITDALAAELPVNGSGGRQIIQVDRIVESLSPARVVELLGPDLAAARSRYGAELAKRAVDAALAGGQGAVGLGDTLGALREGRVAHLLLDESREWHGGRAPDGGVYPPGEVPPGTSPKEMTEEPALGEQMIEMAIGASAEVTVLPPDVAAPLTEADGVAALLRW